MVSRKKKEAEPQTELNPDQPANPVGRPRKEIDIEVLKGLARIQCTMSEMAAVLGIHVDTLRDNYSNVIEQERENGKASLRRIQFGLAQKGNVAMAIWLGKQLLGQRERADIDMSTGLTVVWDERIAKL